jgi:hypothetical protein
MAKKKKRAGLEAIGEKQFIEGFDSYSEEYNKWKRFEIVKRLIGVFELPSDVFHSSTLEEMIAHVGHSDCKVIYYQTDFDNAKTSEKESSVATGCTCAVRDTFQRVRPIVFIRSQVNSSGDDECNPNIRSEAEDGMRLLVLLHELGHAEDIVREVNYRHEALRIDIIGAEVFAHEFVCRYAKRLGYRLALGHYLRDLEEAQSSPNDVVRLSAQRALASMDMEALKAACSMADYDSQAGIRRMLERAGRLDEFIKRAANAK